MSGREILDLLIEIAYLAAIFLIPLWFAYIFPGYNVFELNKSVLFQALVWLMALGTGLKLIFYPPRPGFLRALARKYWLVPLIFIAGWSLTLLASLNPVLSFYGTPERQAGLVNYLFYFAWFALLIVSILTVNNSRARGGVVPVAANLRRIVIAAVSSGFLVALYAVLQIFNLDFLTWPEPPYITGRALSTLGQPDFLASWLLLVLPLACYLAATERRIWRRLGWIFVVVVQFLGLLASGSRGGLAAGLGALLLFLIYLLVSAAWPRRRKIGAIVLFLIFSAAAAWLLNYSSHGRLQELERVDYGSLGARRNFFFASVSAIGERPWFGYGLESGAEVFVRYYEPNWGLYGDVGMLTDRAHDLILDDLINGGAFGLLLTVALYYFFFRLALRNIKNRRDRGLSLALALGAAGYIFSLLLNFRIVAGEVYFWLFLSLLAVIDFSAGSEMALNAAPDMAPVADKPAAGSRLARRSGRLILAGGAALILAAFIGWRIERLARVLAADYYFNEVYQSLPDGDYYVTLQLMSYEEEQKTAPPDQASYDYWLGYQLSEQYSDIGAITPQTAVRDYLKSLDKVWPVDGYRNLFLRGQINLALKNFSAAATYLSAVAALTPHWPPVLIAEGKLAVARGDYAAALSYYGVAAGNLPSAADPRLPAEELAAVLRYDYFIDQGLAQAYEAEKDYADAGKYYLAAYGAQPADYTLLKNIADTYYERGDLTDAIKYVLRGESRSPGDYNWPLALATLYYASGDRAQAETALAAARRLAPAAAQDQLNILEQKYQAASH